MASSGPAFRNLFGCNSRMREEIPLRSTLPRSAMIAPVFSCSAPLQKNVSMLLHCVFAATNAGCAALVACSSQVQQQRVLDTCLGTHGVRALRTPAWYFEIERHNAAARSQVTGQPRLKLSVHGTEQIHGDHCRGAEVRLKKVRALERNLLRESQFSD